ncbi:HNH endonuclease [Peribacillus acanthi]|uniref:HNH endonuclease n=1 Tax=Peribacillus acanthi TaxID=2171554 RepID=UPI000D3EC460|nr:HNH endonuclease signature motif containing protein [Peribacillus acanthi]
MQTFFPIPKPSHKRRVKKRGERSKFSKMVRDAVKQNYNNECAMCSRLAHHVHHVWPRSRSGRNVYTNGLLLCNDCHKEVHADNKLLNHWIRQFKEMYGKHFYQDREDLMEVYKTEFGKKTNLEVQKWMEHNEVFEILRK